MKSVITPGYNFNFENLVSAFLGLSSLNTCGANVVLIQYSNFSILRIKNGYSSLYLLNALFYGSPACRVLNTRLKVKSGVFEVIVRT